MRIYLFILCVLIASKPLAATVTWIGAGDGISWEDGKNWDTTIMPQTSEDVVINSDSVVLNSKVEVKSLKMSSAALYIVSGAELKTNGSSNANWAIHMGNSNMYCLGFISIFNAENAIGVNANSYFELKHSARLRISGGSGFSGLAISGNSEMKLEEDSSFMIENAAHQTAIYNYGKIENYGFILFNSPNAGIGILNSYDADFLNYGDIEISNVTQYGIANYSLGLHSFTNQSSGKIDIYSRLVNSGNFINSGQVKPKGTTGDLIINFSSTASFINYGMLKACLSDNRYSIYIYDSGYFVNETGGVIEADTICGNSNFRGTFLFTFDSGVFENFGLVNLDLNDEASGLLSAGSIQNFGQIQINNAWSTAIKINHSGSFYNDEFGEIDVTGSLNKAIGTQRWAFKGEGDVSNAGKIVISSHDEIGIWQDNDTMINTGEIHVSNAATSVKIGLFDKIRNDECGLITLDKGLEVSTHPLENKGIIYDINHNVKPADVINEGLIYEDLAGAASLSLKNYFPAQADNFFSLFPDSLFSTETLSPGSSVGSFTQHPGSSPPVYFWTPEHNANITDTYFFEATRSTGCSRILKVSRKSIPVCGFRNDWLVSGVSTDFFDRNNWPLNLVPGVCDNITIDQNSGRMVLPAGTKVQYNRILFDTGAVIDIEAGAVLETFEQ